MSIAAREDARHYDLPANPAKATMIARDVFKIGGAIGAGGVLAGAALHGLYVFTKRKDRLKASEHHDKEGSDE